MGAVLPSISFLSMYFVAILFGKFIFGTKFTAKRIVVFGSDFSQTNYTPHHLVLTPSPMICMSDPHLSASHFKSLIGHAREFRN